MGNFGIIVSGGPAPGINSVIASVVIQAEQSGFGIKGFKKGFKGIVIDKQDCVVDLNIDGVLPIASSGGSILGTSRFNPFFDQESQQTFFQILQGNNVDKLVIIGGEGTAYISHKIAKVKPLLRVAHIPKAIDNDLILPNKYPSFGFETARYEGTRILRTIITEARTTDRWFIIRTMGRRAGFLALGLGIAAGATLTLIAEQFQDRSVSPRDVADLIFSSVKKRIRNNQYYGTAVIAEGIIDKFERKLVPELQNCPRDEVGRIRYSEVSLEELVISALREMTKEAGLNVRYKAENIGYEIRSCDPVSFDIEYTRLLGFGAVKYLLEGLSGITVVRDFDNLAYVPLINMVEESGRVHSRVVDCSSDIYKVASSFMIT
jgi:ATP-dependent phosphofructokinase / diphosphate-dependent phosphofructokinase